MYSPPLHVIGALCVLGISSFCTSARGAELYPKVNPAAQYAKLKLHDPNNNGRTWRVAREDWDGARRRVADDPAWAKWLAAERRELDRWMAKHSDHIDWIAGWSHDGISPKDASRIRWTDQIPGVEVEFFSTPSDPKVEITPKLKAWWVVTFRGRHNDMMNRAAHLYKLTGETRYAEWAASQLDFYADNFLKWEPQRKDQQARLFWQTLTEATNLITYADTVRLLGDFPKRERLANWRDHFFLPEVEVINATFQSIHNIGTWQRCAAAQVALLFNDEASWKNALDGEFGLRAQIAKGITSDYIWHEQSLGYNSYVVRGVLTLFTAAGLQGRATLLDHEMTVAENLMLSTTAMRFPDGYIPNPADTNGRLTAPEPEVLADAYRVFPTPLGLSTAAEIRSWNTLLDSPADIAKDFNFDLAHYKYSPATLAPVRSRNMESSRMAILRSGPWQAYFHYGQLTRSHTQSEALNYELYYNDTDMSHDTGTVGYGSPLHRGYYTRGANHNVPLIDGEGQELEAVFPKTTNEKAQAAPSLAKGELLGFTNKDVEGKGHVALIAVDYPRYRTNATVTRTISLQENFADGVEIKTTDGKSHLLGLTVQLQGQAQLPSTFKPVADFAHNRPEPFQQWRNPRVAEFTDHADIAVNYSENLAMKLSIYLKGKFRIYHGNTPDVPPARRETIYIEQEGKEAQITTVFSPAIK